MEYYSYWTYWGSYILQMELKYFNWNQIYGKEEAGVYPAFSGEKIRNSNMPITYQIDHLGFRNIHGPSDGRACASGCSWTFGYGCNTPWPMHLDAYNMGMNGASNDWIVRSTIAYCKKFQPKKAYVMWTFPNRYEWTEEHTGTDKPYWQLNCADYNEIGRRHREVKESHFIITNDDYCQLNKEKNQLLLREFCQNNNIELFEQDTCSDIAQELHSSYELEDKARDYSHPGDKFNQEILTYFTKY
jgi:hypothetical protein